MKVAVLLNRAGGTLQRRPELIEETEAAFRAAGVNASVEALEPDALRDRAEALAKRGGIDALVVGGGDGTVGSVAALLAGSDLPMGILPFGTLNHFAKDAGLPAELDEAVKVIAAGHARAVDLAEVNGRVFVNNSSVGLYPLMVRDRERQQEYLGRGKWPAMARAAGRALWRLSKWRLRISVEGETEHIETPILFVGNNRYETGLFGLGKRAALDEGKLYLYAIKARSRLKLAKAMTQALLGRLDENDFVVLSGSSAQVDSRKDGLHVAADGEAFVAETPLRYRIRPGALKLIVPLASDAPAS
ncbi:diacylglycerol/lipid kinase family protein [Sphingomonas tabacisoli]|uniref:Diacylglycerol/lipid kinase family protein n=1 Tax=Sphingomonas tabacisoli TaxID=2249466 RepID=A0ABW4I2H7_9SPHN